MSATNFEIGVSSPPDSFDSQLASESVVTPSTEMASGGGVDRRRDLVPVHIVAEVARVVAAVMRQRPLGRIVGREERRSRRGRSSRPGSR